LFSPFDTKTNATAHIGAMILLLPVLLVFLLQLLYRHSGSAYVQLAPLSPPLSAPLHRGCSSQSITIDTIPTHSAAIASKKGVLGEW
jgi:hypothetical protein